MIAERIYLDHNATSALRPEARAAAIDALDTLGNPSSVHGEGRQARRIVEDAREKVAALAGTAPANVIFTSGATEANNAVLGADWDCILVARSEHDSVLAPARQGAADCVEISCNGDGLVEAGEIAEHILRAPYEAGRMIATLQMANNETGVLQDVGVVADFCAAHGVAFHTDAVQAAGRVGIDFDDLGADSLSLSSHKLGGPAGVGALVLRDGNPLAPLLVGGGQERRRRSGTENVSGIAGFGAACEAAMADLSVAPPRLAGLRDRIEDEIRRLTPGAVVIGAAAGRLGNTTCVAIPQTAAETMLIKLDLAGVAVSSGAACSSGKVGVSHVLTAMGVPEHLARGAIRISLGWNSSGDEVEAFLDIWRNVMEGGARAVA